MYRTAKGEEIFVIDGHTHSWDGSPANQKNIHGKQFIDCFYAYHSNLSPPSEKWEKEKFEKYDAKTMYDDLFVNGYDDMAILQPTYLTDFYKNGFNTTERNSEMKKSHPDRFILNGAFDPRDGTKGLEQLHALSEKHKLKGVKLYTAEWRGESKGYKLTDKASYKYLEAAQKLGIKNIHVHKGPTILPLNRDDQVPYPLLVCPGDKRLLIAFRVARIKLRKMLMHKGQESRLRARLEKQRVGMEEVRIRLPRLASHRFERPGVVGDARHQWRTHHTRAQPRLAQAANRAEA